MSRPVPFERTVCACEADVALCRRAPGSCGSGDVERILDYLDRTAEDGARRDPADYFEATPGFLGMRPDGSVRHVGMIAPRLDEGGCIFLTAEGRCRVHPVAPFGCAYFDVHQSDAEGKARSAWYAFDVDRDPLYRAQRLALQLAGADRSGLAAFVQPDYETAAWTVGIVRERVIGWQGVATVPDEAAARVLADRINGALNVSREQMLRLVAASMRREERSPNGRRPRRARPAAPPSA